MNTDPARLLAEKLGNPQDLLRRKRRMDRDVRYALSHLKRWREEHPNSWIAVFEEKLLAAEASQERLVKKLKNLNVPLSEVYIDFIAEEEPLIVVQLDTRR